MLSFGQRLKFIRKEAQLTQAELAEKLMVSVQAISKWECDTSMPDISQIVPLSAILGVTTDCLLGVGGDENADRNNLYERIKSINKGIENVYGRKDNAFYECYELYREHIKKYPLDYEIKLLCADSIVRIIYYGHNTVEEKEKLYNEAVNLLLSVINYDRDTTRQIDAKQTLIILYLYFNNFAKAEEVAEGLPYRGGIRSVMEVEIYSKKNDHTKCLEASNVLCSEAVHLYLKSLAIKARRISLSDVKGKQDSISAWLELLEAIKLNNKIFDDISINVKWLYSAFNNLANDYISMSETDYAFEVIEELVEALISDYRKCKGIGDSAKATEIKTNFKFYLHCCYDQCFSTEDNVITKDPRFKKCEERLLAEG